MAKYSEFGYLPMCVPAEGKPWFAGSVIDEERVGLAKHRRDVT